MEDKGFDLINRVLTGQQSGQIDLTNTGTIVSVPGNGNTITISHNSSLKSDTIPFADEELHGMLIPANDPTPRNACSKDPMQKDTALVLIGDNGFGVQFGRMGVLEIGPCDAVSMERTPDGASFNAELADFDDNTVVRIINNRIATVLNGETYTARQSRDRATLTVKNKRGDELFYARFLNKETIRIRGYFGCAGHTPIRISDNQPIPGLMMTGSCLIGYHTALQIE